MSQLSFSSFDTSLMVRDAQGRYLLATTDQILEAARQAIEHKMQRSASFSSPAAVKEYRAIRRGTIVLSGVSISRKPAPALGLRAL